MMLLMIQMVDMVAGIVPHLLAKLLYINIWKGAWSVDLFQKWKND